MQLGGFTLQDFLPVQKLFNVSFQTTHRFLNGGFSKPAFPSLSIRKFSPEKSNESNRYDATLLEKFPPLCDAIHHGNYCVRKIQTKERFLVAVACKLGRN